MPRGRHKFLSFTQMSRWTNWRQLGVRERSDDSDGSVKSKGPSKRVSGCASWIVSAQAMYRLGSGVTDGMKSTLVPYSMILSLAVLYLCQIGHHLRCCSGRVLSGDGDEKK